MPVQTCGGKAVQQDAVGVRSRTQAPGTRSGGLLTLAQPFPEQLCCAVASQRHCMPLYLVNISIQRAQLLLQLLQLLGLL